VETAGKYLLSRQKVLCASARGFQQAVLIMIFIVLSICLLHMLVHKYTIGVYKNVCFCHVPILTLKTHYYHALQLSNQGMFLIIT